MRIRVTTQAEADDLLAYLSSRVDAVAELVADGELEVSLLGSFTQPAMRQELDRRLRTWEEARRTGGVPATVVPLASRLKLAATPADSGHEWSGQAASPSRPRRSGLR